MESAPSCQVSIKKENKFSKISYGELPFLKEFWACQVSVKKGTNFRKFHTGNFRSKKNSGNFPEKLPQNPKIIEFWKENQIQFGHEVVLFSGISNQNFSFNLEATRTSFTNFHIFPKLSLEISICPRFESQSNLKMQQSAFSLDLCLRKTLAGKSYDYR